MIDLSEFLVERERLRRFCFQQTAAAVVIRDVQGSDRGRLPATRLAEWLQFLLAVDAARFLDPDDSCEVGPSFFAVPTGPSTKRCVATTLDNCEDQCPVIVDYRVGDAIWPIVAPHLMSDKLREIKTWDRVLRQRHRIGSIITLDAAVDRIAIQCDGSRLLRRSNGETLDIAGGFWLEAYHEISSQRCSHREAWQRSAFDTFGNA